MMSNIRELSEDERIRQQLQAREDYERRLIGQYNRGHEDGVKEGMKEGMKKIILDAMDNGSSLESISKVLGISLDNAKQLINL